MHTTSPLDELPTKPAQPIVREYASSRAFHQDAQALYIRTGYTVSHASGLAHRGLRDSLLFFAREFGWPRRQHLVITYAPPTLPRHEAPDVR